MPGWPANPPGGNWIQTDPTNAHLNCNFDPGSNQQLVPSSLPDTIACANGQWSSQSGQFPTCTLPTGGGGRRLLDAVELEGGQ
jgi:hypothetical protein